MTADDDEVGRLRARRLIHRRPPGTGKRIHSPEHIETEPPLIANSSPSLPLVSTGVVAPLARIHIRDLKVQKTGMPGAEYDAVAAVVTLESVAGRVIAAWRDDEVMVSLRDLHRKDTMDVDDVDFTIYRHGANVTLQVEHGRSRAESETPEEVFDAAIASAVDTVDAWASRQPEADDLGALHESIWQPQS